MNITLDCEKKKHKDRERLRARLISSIWKWNKHRRKENLDKDLDAFFKKKKAAR